MNILVTGANGQLGNELRTLAVGSCHNFVFTDISRPDGVQTELLDITDIGQIREIVGLNHIECIINCAAFTNVDAAEDQEELAYRLNARAVDNLASVAREVGAFLIHISTDYVFAGNSCLPLSEDELTSPTGAYGRTKLAGEKAVADSGCHYIILRTAWLYSPYGKNFVKTMRSLTATRPTLNVVFDQVGTPTYAHDLAEAIMHIVNTGRMVGYEGIYHFSNEGVCSWYDFACAIADASGNTACRISPCHSDEFPSKVKRPAFSVLDKTKFKSTFSFDIPNWMDSLKKCISVLKSDNR